MSALPGYDEWLQSPYTDSSEVPDEVEDAYDLYVENFWTEARKEYERDLEPDPEDQISYEEWIRVDNIAPQDFGDFFHEWAEAEAEAGMYARLEQRYPDARI